MINVVPGISGPSYEYTILTLKSQRSAYSFSLIPFVTDLEIFEHLDKPYLTGRVIFVDDKSIVSSYDISGGETLTVEIKSTSGSAESIQRTFYITGIEYIRRVNEEAEVVSLQLIEDIGYISNLITFSKSFNDTSYNLISLIASEYLNVAVYTPSDGEENAITNDFQDKTKVIIPNLNPLEAMSWIKNKTTDKDGMPFYLFSSFTDNQYPLHFEDLTTLMREPAMNTEPYIIWNGAASHPNPKQKSAQVLSFRYADTNNMFSLIRRGGVGAQYSYINTFNGTKYDYKLDAIEDVVLPYLQNILDADDIERYGGTMPVDDRFTHNEKAFNTMTSRRFSKIASSGAYASGPGSARSYDEEQKTDDYNKKAISRAVNMMLTMSPLEIVVHGNGYIDGITNTTIGRKIKINSVKPGINKQSMKDILDPKRSGDFLIYSARHMFKSEGAHHISFTCVKIGNKA